MKLNIKNFPKHISDDVLKFAKRESGFKDSLAVLLSAMKDTRIYIPDVHKLIGNILGFDFEEEIERIRKENS